MKPASQNSLLETVKALEEKNQPHNKWNASQLTAIFTRVLDSEEVRGIPNFPGMKEKEALALIDGEYSWIVPVSPNEEGEVVMGAPYFVKTIRLQQYLEDFPPIAGIPYVLEQIQKLSLPESL